MTADPTPPASADEVRAPLLEVTVLHPRDAEAATAGQADRLLVVSDPASGGRTPERATVSAVLRETDLPVRVVLRDDDAPVEDGAAVRRLADRADDLRALGVEGVSFGFLDRDLDVDARACEALAALLPGVPWTFHRGFDDTLDPTRAWREVRGLTGLDGVASAGSRRGLAAGAEELLDRVGRDPLVGRLLLVSGGLTAEHVPWLVRAGVRQFGLAEEARPDGSWTKAYVDADYVRTWRMLLDDAAFRAAGVAVD